MQLMGRLFKVSGLSLFLASLLGSFSASARPSKNLNCELKKILGDRFHQTDMQEIYMSCPMPTTLCAQQ